MSTRFLILCKFLAKNGVLDIQVNLANHNEAYIPKTGKNVTRIQFGVCTTRSYNFRVRLQYPVLAPVNSPGAFRWQT